MVPPVPWTQLHNQAWVQGHGGTAASDNNGNQSVSFYFNLGASLGWASINASMSMSKASGNTVDNGYLNMDWGDDNYFDRLPKPANYTYHMRANYYWISVSCGLVGGSKGPEGNVGATLFTWPTNKGVFTIYTHVQQHQNRLSG